MKQFVYKYTNAEGKIRTGKLLAENLEAAERQVPMDTETILISLKENKFYIPISLELQDKDISIKTKDLINFTRQLQILLSSGTSMIDS